MIYNNSVHVSVQNLVQNHIYIYIFTFIHLADAFIQSDLQLLYMSEVARLWSN